ncbi:type 2 lanthipeptide synthetase LanM family protein [Streptomyces sp. NBC_00669]|uniref:type 2 lanthipeptide synthetase LanM family protein n=1 Tax=Streptomyces sp. NBC_00669 TaxID=2976011 RepID=UPI002E311B42|nr:type 2 lanthipeptide synthetase LanM family protein [Streptomyces sp. NBC_00669]
MASKTRPTAARPLAMPWERRGRPALTGAWWVRALRLDERAATGWPEADDAGPAEDGDAESDDAAAVADIRLRRWRDAFADLAADALDRQTGEYGGTPRQLRTLLAEPPERLAQRVAKPAWALDVERVAASVTGDHGAKAPAGPPAPDGTRHDGSRHGAGQQETGQLGGWQRGFALVVEPFVHESLRRFDAATDNIGPSSAADRAAVRDAARGEVTRRLVRLASRVLVLELNVLRVTGRLDGDAPEERFWSFVRHFRRPAPLAELLDEYAVLARLMIATAGQVAAVHAEFLQRLVQDRPELVRRLFGGAAPGPLARVELAKGDTHGGGRSVGVATFASGARAVYKPRPLSMHRHFNDVIDWYNGRLPGPSRLRTLTVVDRGEHGWVEFVAPAPCADSAAATRYFHRQGALLALLHSLGGVDFHFENLIAVGDQPVPIDLESLFCADLPRSYGSATLDGDPAVTAYRESVGRVGLLPSVVVGADGQAFDAGGMGGDEDAALPYRVVDWTGAGTDAMRLDRVQPVLGSVHNRPRLDGADLDAVRYAGPLLDGYREGYAAIAAGRGELLYPGEPLPTREARASREGPASSGEPLAPDGPLAPFAGDLARVIPRPTHEYATLLAETTHPDVLRDALDRDQVFGVLWARAAADPARARLVRHEVADLWAGDVPLFTARADSRDVRTAGGAVLADLLPESGAALVGRALAGMGGRGLDDQRWIVSAHLATRTSGAEPGPSGDAAGSGRALPDRDLLPSDLSERALAAARAVADRLEASAYASGGRLGWLGLDLWQESRWSVRPLGVDLYNGYAGIALFLAQLAHVTGEPRHADLARGALGPVAGYAAEVLDAGGAHEAEAIVGAFTGMSGVAYALACSSALLGDASARALVAPLLELARERVSQDVAHDVISGTAGCLAVAEALSADHGWAAYRPAAHRLAERCAEALVAGAVPAGDGVGWPGTAHRPLLGFSHGAAGAGWALLSYAARTGDGGARAAGLRAFGYERGAYDARSGNWPDHRKAEPSSQHSWCHGAPGVGLARAAVLHAYSRVPEAPGFVANLADLRRALDSTARFDRHRNHSLCHGALGNLELLSTARTLGASVSAGGADGAGGAGGADGAHHTAVQLAWSREASAAVAQIERDGPVCGTPGGIATPGLMTGLAGIGHGLLRIAAPEQVAPVLLLAPPPPV